MGGTAWPARKDRIRQAYYDKIIKPTPEEAEESPPLTTDDPSTPPALTGAAAGPAATAAESSAPKAAPSPAPASTATSATATAGAAVSTDPPTSGTSATNTSPPSSASTVWQETPLGFVERSLSPTIVDPSGRLAPGLPARIQKSLRVLATGRGEPVEAVVQAIAEFYVEQEDERAEGPLADALQHYVENQLV